ncbi:hypothetical protein ABIE44_000819 [Marmoricola sp. OAE513]|uniref:hypothetical protein n=1 Tax=Marmoricola sp. OAE513 TaxID=2817894 RepID=UPI001AEA2F9F
MSTDVRVIYLAPSSGSSGVGDYADDFAAAVRPHVRELVQFRHGPARADSARGILRERRRLRELVRRYDDGTPLVVHCELSGGAAVPFWAVRPLIRDGVRVTATLHDPPRPVWYPFLTRGVSKGRVLNQAIHRPLHRVLEGVERRTLAGTDLFVLTSTGAAATRALGMGRSVTEARLILPVRDALPPVTQRPLAVGLFGHVYTGKGFDLVPALRRALPDDVALRVAGRGTENLPRTPGVEILGAVEGTDEDAFFASIRVLLMPYARPPVGAHAMLPASATHTHALAYRTPTLALRSPDTAFLEAEGLAVVVDGGAAELAAAAGRLATWASELDRLVGDLDAYLAADAVRDPAQPFLEVWSRP